ncbi:hypothetical protein [Nonomuraea coxensis]|uniref:hypothetical protein n=1 Tax=Nonomuraea coxensis TaxID=404386 RepID=UPI0012F886DB|nr:hypothetical protein [Nonomuraea coxensis]
MTRDLVRGGWVGLVVGAGVGYPVSRLYEEDIETYTVLPLVVVAVAVVGSVGVWLAVRMRISRPVRGAMLAAVLLVVAKNAVELAVPSPGPWPAFGGFVVLAVVSCAGGAALAGTAALLPRVVAAVAVCGCVVTTATVEHRRVEASGQRLRADLVAAYEKSLPLVVPAVVPGRVLVDVGAIDDEVLTLGYARDEGDEPDVFVQVSGGGDPREACAAWEPRFGPCERAAADRWLTKKKTGGRQVMVAGVDGRLVQVDSDALSREEALAVAGGGLRAVSAEYLVELELRDGR